MKVIRLLMVAALAASCEQGPADRESRPDVQPPPVATSGETAEPEPAPKVEQRAPVNAQRQPAQQVAAAATPVANQAKAAGVNPDAAVLQDFKKRVDVYMSVRNDAKKGAPPLKETDDPAKLKAAQDGLAQKIRTARAAAKHGDIFSPEITAAFRRLLSPELKGEEGSDAKKVLKDDAPTPASVPVKVNAKYPDGAPVSTVPANLLLNLPTLPEPLQYRVIGQHLILLDEDADVIVDYAPNVIR